MALAALYRKVDIIERRLEEMAAEIAAVQRSVVLAVEAVRDERKSEEAERSARVEKEGKK